jgi:hypothetical protein
MLQHFKEKELMKSEYEERLEKLKSDYRALGESKEETLLVAKSRIETEEAEENDRGEGDNENANGNENDNRQQEEEIRELKRQLIETKIATLQENRELRDQIDAL